MSSKIQEINITGLAIHIGSQITQTTPFVKSFSVITKLMNNLKRMGFSIKSMDVGGGLGVQYNNEKTISLKKYGSIVSSLVSKFGCELILEPGRFIVADAGILVTKVLRTKSNQHKRFIIVDLSLIHM